MDPPMIIVANCPVDPPLTVVICNCAVVVEWSVTVGCAVVMDPPVTLVAG